MNKHAFIGTSAAVLLGFAAVLSFGLTPAGPQKVESPWALKYRRQRFGLRHRRRRLSAMPPRGCPQK